MSGRAGRSAEAHGDAGSALVLGASGGIGAALVAALEAEGRWRQVIGLSRRSEPAVDITEEASIAAAAAWLAGEAPDLALVVVATGFLHAGPFQPEKAMRQLDPAHLAQSFAVNAIGPAMAMKHLLPRLRRDGPAVFATLSARVGSIGDNKLGGWWSYRASKAALNQLVRTASIELKRANPGAAIVAIHPGTVDSGLSSPFAKAGLEVQAPAEAARRILDVLAGLGPTQSGGFFDHKGAPVAW
jgi:NAD(P)-dependent dehydrogenase (short-subunit alcohol dehydrogenase family)